MSKLKTYTAKDLGSKVFSDRLSPEQLWEMKVVSAILPFKVNSYVIEELINWNNVPFDGMFQLTFPQKGMLSQYHYDAIEEAILKGDEEFIANTVHEIQLELNPHPADQMTNIPKVGEEVLDGIQHKYDTTVLFFPSQGQTCHSYCTYCFRWPQFVKLDDLKFASNQARVLTDYLRANPQVTDVLFTGGDPMIMSSAVLRRYVEPLLTDEFSHVNIRIGTKSVAYWPHRFVTDPDADDLLGLFREIVVAGRHLAIQAHYSLPVELSTRIAQTAVRRIRETGAVIRAQSPIIRHVNDTSDSWKQLVTKEIELGIIPYYMFVERDTGARPYFEIPLERVLRIYSDVIRGTSGLAHTMRGPVMSAGIGKVQVVGVVGLGENEKKYFVLKLLQARDKYETGRVFFARYNDTVCWYDDLELAVVQW